MRVPDPDRAAIDEQRLRPSTPGADQSDEGASAAEPGSPGTEPADGLGQARNVAVSALVIANALLFLTVTVITVVAMIRLALGDLGPFSLIFAIPAAATGTVTALSIRAWRRNRRRLTGARGNALLSLAVGIILLILYLALRNDSSPSALGYSDEEMRALVRFFGFLVTINVPTFLLGIRPAEAPKSTRAPTALK